MTKITTPVPDTAFGADFFEAYGKFPVKPDKQVVYLDGSVLVHLAESVTIDGDRKAALAVCSRQHELALATGVIVHHAPMTCVMVKNEVLEQVAKCKEQMLWEDLHEQTLYYVMALCRASGNDDLTRPLSSRQHYVPADYMSGRWLIQAKGRGTRMISGARGTSTMICWDDENWSIWFKKLRELKLKRDEWEGGKAGPPNDVSIRNADVFVECLQQAEYPPKQIAPSVVGGVGLTFRCEKKKVYVEFTNKGAVNALFSDGETRPVVEKVQPSAGHYFIFIDKAKAYLNE
jgi:hypothetical protein